MGLFENKVALVTGASSGIGRETSLAFAKEGAKVVVSDINTKGGEETVELIKKAGGEAKFIKNDVSDANEVKKMIEETVKLYGSLDIAINNAGIGGAWGRLADYDIEEYQKVIDVNVSGVFYCLKYEIQQMLKQGGGAIVNISSIAGLKGLQNSGPYSASKHAVLGLTKTAALEYATKNIRVNAIAPVFTLTPLFEQIFKINAEYEEKLKNNVPMKRYGSVQDIANGILWLCSDQAGFITGHTMPIDGGMTAG